MKKWGMVGFGQSSELCAVSEMRMMAATPSIRHAQSQSLHLETHSDVIRGSNFAGLRRLTHNVYQVWHGPVVPDFKSIRKSAWLNLYPAPRRFRVLKTCITSNHRYT